MIAPTDLLWALIGLILTIGGTFLQASITNPPWSWWHDGLQPYALGITYQIGAVLLVGCLGGKNAAAISQIAYLVLGLLWRNVFTQGGGLDYIYQPSFGYLLGFVPGAWVCGALAFRLPNRLESLAFSCLSGLLTIHAVGLSYLAIAHQANWLLPPMRSLWDLALTYSISPFPGQLVVLCAVTVLSLVLRQFMLY